MNDELRAFFAGVVLTALVVLPTTASCERVAGQQLACEAACKLASQSFHSSDAKLCVCANGKTFPARKTGGYGVSP